ncbi:hypothetical protein JOF53_008023 [Crossiella equi]|uniref:Uncharacterized protein n=1 Tax=Crossiella equi TaxID=130796 RepID=A0ABS5ARV4_9PSEU|nr:hypothetical protein [Crossiella equi]MBP2479151.1 hypothetical protein [Crossiella equi]
MRTPVYRRPGLVALALIAATSTFGAAQLLAVPERSAFPLLPVPILTNVVPLPSPEPVALPVPPASSTVEQAVRVEPVKPKPRPSQVVVPSRTTPPPPPAPEATRPPAPPPPTQTIDWAEAARQFCQLLRKRWPRASCRVS